MVAPAKLVSDPSDQRHAGRVQRGAPTGVRGPLDRIELVELLDPETGELTPGHVELLPPGRVRRQHVDSLDGLFAKAATASLVARPDGSPSRVSVDGVSLQWDLAHGCDDPMDVHLHERDRVAVGVGLPPRTAHLRVACGKCEPCLRRKAWDVRMRAVREAEAVVETAADPAWGTPFLGNSPKKVGEPGTRCWWGTLTVNPQEHARLWQHARELAAEARAEAERIVKAMHERLDRSATGRRKSDARAAATPSVQWAMTDFEAWERSVYRSRRLAWDLNDPREAGREGSAYLYRAFSRAVRAFFQRAAVATGKRWRRVQWTWTYELTKAGAPHAHFFLLEQGDPVLKRELDGAWSYARDGRKGGTREEIAARMVSRGFTKIRLVRSGSGMLPAIRYVTKYITKGGAVRSSRRFGGVPVMGEGRVIPLARRQRIGRALHLSRMERYAQHVARQRERDALKMERHLLGEGAPAHAQAPPL